MTGRPPQRARWKPSTADLPEMRIDLLPPGGLGPEISHGFAYSSDSQSSLPTAHKLRPILIFDLFAEYLRRPSWDYSSPKARSKSARALQNASKPCRY